MTTLTANPVEDRLRFILAVDAVVVGLSGLLLAATPASWYGDLPGWLVRAAGIAVVLAAAGVAVASRWRSRRLLVAGTLTADSAFAWTALMVVAAEVGDVRGSGLEVLVLSGLTTLVFGILETSLVRALR